MTDVASQQQSASLPAIDLREVALFLDFDGTLAPIEARPDLVRLPDPTRDALRHLHGAVDGALAILSGRDLSDIDRLIAPLALPVAGSHGLVRRDAVGAIDDAAAGSQDLSLATDHLARFAAQHGLLLEPKRGGASLHYRSHPSLAASCLALADEIDRSFEELRVIRGHMVVEITVRGRDKGSALTAFMAEPPFRGRMPIAAGDDTTDEDAFAAAQRLGGLGIRVGPGETQARFRVPDIEAFHRWLNALSSAKQGGVEGLHA